MRKLLLTLFTLSYFSVYGQGVVVISEAETESIPTFEKVMNQWMGAVKTTMNMEDARTVVFREQGTRTLRILRWFDSLSDMAKQIEDQESNNDKVMETMQGMTPLEEGTFEKFAASTDFKEGSVWKFRPDLSTADETFATLSKEEQNKAIYRRVQYFDVDFGQNEAFEDSRKKMNELDKSIGVNFHLAVFQNIFGSRDAEYMVIIIDNSRFDYHKNWEKRMKLRRDSKEWQDAVANSNLDNWAVLRESSWNRLVRLSY